MPEDAPREEMHQEHGSALENNPRDILYANFAHALHSDEYEVVEQAKNKITDLIAWRDATNNSSFPQFYQLFETATQVNGASVAPAEKITLRQKIFDQLLLTTQTMSPRVRDLYTGVLSELTGESFVSQFDMTERQIAELRESGDLNILQDASMPWSVKINRIQTRLERELLGRKALDRNERRVSADEDNERDMNQVPPVPPPESDESKPSMDEMSRLKEGEEAVAIWTIHPAHGGYFKEQSYDSWDPERNIWRQSRYTYERIASLSGNDDGEIQIQAYIPTNQRTRVPIPYTHEFASASTGGHQIFADQNGDVVVLTQENQQIDIMLKKRATEPRDMPPHGVLTMPCVLSQETEQALDQIKLNNRTPIDRARAVRTYVLRRLEYSNDSSYNAQYESFSEGYIGAIDHFKKADCDVANTYFAALCTKLGIQVRHVTGHMVKGKDEQENARITSGTGHAWSEVWDPVDRHWVRIDATPSGDPQLEEESKLGAEHVPGDYGEAGEALMPTDEELQALEEKLANLTESLSYTAEERRLSEEAGVSLSEARQITREIDEAEQTRLPNGERVVDVMAQLFSLIIESRKINAPVYTGPVRKREGGEEIEYIVDHMIGIRTGDFDPISRKKEHEESEISRVFGGMTVHIIGDKSGSMSETVDGQTKWQIQRKMDYLILSPLHRFEQNLKRSRVRMQSPLTVQTQEISFRGSAIADIDTDKPLSSTFSSVDKVRLWNSLGNQGSGNGDVTALQIILNQLTESEEQSNGGNPSLTIVIACSDGMPDNPEEVRHLAIELGKRGAITIGIGMTETAAQVPVIFNTEFSHGDIARNIEDLPVIVAKYIVQAAAELFPEKVKPLYQKQINTILAKFDKVGVA